ncbi:MAG: hypothetical protein KGH69_01060 [Candidatus Micrarchaeota archaeon]|nr:hypothetical protein [Candidatus Micrarchaeota archaeon]
MSMYREPKNANARLLDMLNMATGYTRRMGHSDNAIAKAQFCMHMGKALNGAGALLGIESSTRKEELKRLLRIGAVEEVEFGPFETQHIEYARRIATHVQALAGDAASGRINPTNELIYAYAGARKEYEDLVGSIGS